MGVAKHVDFYGYYDDTTLSFGSLDHTRFSISSNNYQVDRVFTQPGLSLAFTLNSAFTMDEQKTLALHICDQAFAFSVAGAPSGSTYAFNATDFPGAGLTGRRIPSARFTSAGTKRPRRSTRPR